VDRVQGHDIPIVINLEAAAVAGAAVAGAVDRADVADGVGIQRHRARLRQGSAVQNGCGGGESDALQGENISFERSAGTQRGRTADLPEHAKVGAAIGTEIDHLDGRGAGGRERAADLENPIGIVVALRVERKGSRQLSRRVKMIDARRECLSTQILTSQVAGERHGCQTKICRGGIDLRLIRDIMTDVDRPVDEPRPSDQAR